MMLTLSTLSVALARQMRHNMKTVSARHTPLQLVQRDCLAFQSLCGGVTSYLQPARNFRLLSFENKWLGPIYRGVTMSLFEGDDRYGGDGRDNIWAASPSSSSLPYSTTSSNSAPAVDTINLSSMSSLPFRAPRSSFDDSMPASLTSDGKVVDGALEWSKLGLLTELVDAVVGNTAARRGLGLIDGPTPVQKMAIPEILAGCKDRMASVENISKYSSDVNPPMASSAQTDSIPQVRSIAFAAATGSGKRLPIFFPSFNHSVHRSSWRLVTSRIRH